MLLVNSFLFARFTQVVVAACIAFVSFSMDRVHFTAVASDTIVNAIFVLLFRIQRKLTKYILAQCTVREKLMLL